MPSRRGATARLPSESRHEAAVELHCPETRQGAGRHRHNGSMAVDQVSDVDPGDAIAARLPASSAPGAPPPRETTQTSAFAPSGAVVIHTDGALVAQKRLAKPPSARAFDPDHGTCAEIRGRVLGPATRAHGRGAAGGGPGDQERVKGRTWVSQLTRPLGLRVCVHTRPGPVISTTNPSPDFTAFMNPPAVLASMPTPSS